MDIQELKQAIIQSKNDSKGMDIKGKAKILHSIIDDVAENKKYNLKLQK